MNNLDSSNDRLSKLSPAKRLLFEQRIKAASEKQVGKVSILPRGDRQSLPLSISQEHILLAQSLEPDSPMFNRPLALSMKGSLDKGLLIEAIQCIFERHTVLRTKFTFSAGFPQQVMQTDFRFSLEEIDLSDLPTQEQLYHLNDLLTKNSRIAFKISEEIPVRACLYCLDPKYHVLFLIFHHIAFDAWSARIFQRELMIVYQALLEHEAPNLPELPIEVADFASWERASLQGENYANLLNYWKNYLVDFPPALDFLVEKPRPERQTYNGSTFKLELPIDLVRKLQTLSKNQGVTLYMTMLAAFLVLLYRYSRQNDLVIGTPTAGRNYPELENLIGGFINLLPLRFQLDGKQRFTELLDDVRKVMLDVLDHQELPFGRILRDIPYGHDPSRSPFFQVVFNMEDVSETPSVKTGLKIEPFEFETGVAAFDLTLEITTSSTKVTCWFEFNNDLFELETIQNLARHYCSLLTSITSNSTANIIDLALLDESERHTLLYDWNKTNFVVDYQTSLMDRFQAQVSRSAQDVAFICNGERITYADLDSKSDHLASYLQGCGVEPGTKVGLLLERSLQATIAFIAILKCNAVYLPLDPAYPAERLTYIIADADVKVILTNSNFDRLLQDKSCKRVYIDDALLVKTVSATALKRSSAQPDDPAYLIYTSGSTGQPKGVAVPHRQIINRLEWMWREIPFVSGEMGCQKTALSFVDSLWELLGYLLQGYPTVILPDEVMRDPHKLVGELAAQRVSRLWLIPPLLKLLLDTYPDLAQRLPDLKVWVTTGEEIPPNLYWRFRESMPHATLYNLYGTSEVWDATIYSPEPAHRKRPHVPIGKPIANVQAYVLDEALRPVPVYATGELCIGGDGLALGYLNSAELTNSKFVANPFSEVSGSHLYRSGDLACYLPDGQIEFIGRADNQLKIRGVRVELGEIETLLEKYPGVRQAVVTASEVKVEQIQLTAHLVTSPEAFDERGLKLYLKSRLPDYMLPAIFCIHAALPQTPSGKIDRLKLSQECIQKQPIQKRLVKPETEIEKRLVGIWEQFLTTRPIGIQDDFFELGGNSLLAAQMFHQIEKTFGKKLPLASLFKAPTVELQAVILQDQDLAMAWSSLVELRVGSNQKLPIFFVAPVGGNVLSYRDLLRYLPDSQPCYGLQAVGLDGIQKPLRNVREVARHYIQEMRTVQPHGPYLLSGSSFGGLVSYEIAQELSEAGEPIALVAMMDTYGPHYPRRLPVMGRLIRKTAHQVQRLQTHLSNLRATGWLERASYIQIHGLRLWNRMIRRAIKKQNAREKALPPELKQVYSAQLNAARQRSRHLVEPPRFSGRLVLFRASHQPIGIQADPTSGWGSVAGDKLEIYELPGHHTSLIYEPRVRGLVEKFSAILDEIQANR